MQLKHQTQPHFCCVSKSPSLPAGACCTAAVHELLLDCHLTRSSWFDDMSHLLPEQLWDWSSWNADMPRLLSDTFPHCLPGAGAAR